MRSPSSNAINRFSLQNSRPTLAPGEGEEHVTSTLSFQAFESPFV